MARTEAPLAIRTGTRADADTIAALHARSWQITYRGLFSDAFLDGPVLEERRGLWRSRLDSWDAARNVVLLAEAEGELQGFASVLLDIEPQWGARLDNLHVNPHAKARGIGRQLVCAAAQWVRDGGEMTSLHLMVFERNEAARGFYDAMRGKCVERREVTVEDGTRLVELRYLWKDLGELIKAA